MGDAAELCWLSNMAELYDPYDEFNWYDIHSINRINRRMKMSEGNISGLNLNVEEESKAAAFDALPPGEYPVIITKSEAKENKSGSGMHISVTFTVIEGEHEGRLLFTNWNVQNSNPTAEKIGRAELAACCKAVGVLNPTDSSELHDKPLVVRVAIDKKDPTRNEVKGYGAIEAEKPVARAPEAYRVKAPESVAKAEQPVPPAAKPATGKKPWQK